MIRCCKNCENRHRACWDNCETYKKEKQFHEANKIDNQYIHYQILKKARLNKWENI